MSRIRINKKDIEEIKQYNSETMISIRASKRFQELCWRWRVKYRKPVKQLIVYATLKYLMEEEGSEGIDKD